MKIKRKGAYCWKSIHHVDDPKDAELGWHQNQSALIVPMAAEAAMVYGKDVEEFIRNHKNEYDFMLRAKIPRNSRLVLVSDDGSEQPLQNVCRYYPSVNGGKLIKIMPPLPGGEEERRVGIDKNWKVKPCNNMKDFDWDIDYTYYAQQANKLIIKE